MPFGLTIGTERATALQHSIQDELIRRGYSQDADPVMAEYITIMIINNKTAEQITAEMEDLIGSDYDASFTTWLFSEAAKGGAEPEPSPAELPSPVPKAAAPVRDTPPHLPSDSLPRRPSQAGRNGVYQQALSQALPSGSGQKRPASARSPSPNHPNKMRRTDLPTGPRAMQRDPPHGSRSLLERVGGHAPNYSKNDDIQARIDNITGTPQDNNMMMPGGFPGMGNMPPGMDMNAMAAASMGNPMMLQEIMMNQMALMAQISGMMGPNQFAGGAGFPMQNMGDMNGFAGGMGHANSGRGRGRGGRGGGRGRGGSHSGGHKTFDDNVKESDNLTPADVPPSTPAIVSTTAVAAPQPTSAALTGRPGFVVPERPQSPTLCKFASKCTNAHCRYSHPSPVATPESGVVLSNDACENGKDCKDKDCIKSHVSPAVLNPKAVEQSSIPQTAAPAPAPAPAQYHQPSTPTVIPCRFGNACTRPNCPYQHPSPAASHNHFAQPCRFGAGCTRADCKYQHPAGRTLPSSFHRGLSSSSPLVTVSSPETGSMGPSYHKSVTFNNQSIKDKLDKQVKELEEKKTEAEKAVKAAEDAARKKDGTKAVAIIA